MPSLEALTAAEQRIEEIREIRRRLFGGSDVDLAKLRELGSHLPPGFRFAKNVRPLMPLSEQLAESAEAEVHSTAG